MTKAELIEALADIEHQRWSDWQAWLHQQCGTGLGIATREESLWIPPERVKHWENLMHTQYYALPEHSKQSDRDQVARYLPLIVEFVAEWLEQEPPDGHRPSLKTLAEEWRREMA